VKLVPALGVTVPSGDCKQKLVLIYNLQKFLENVLQLNLILHTAWLDNHALTLKSDSAKYYLHEKSRFLHTFLKFCCESRKI
jgi:hypothetical protein